MSLRSSMQDSMKEIKSDCTNEFPNYYLVMCYLKARNTLNRHSAFPAKEITALVLLAEWLRNDYSVQKSSNSLGWWENNYYANYIGFSLRCDAKEVLSSMNHIATNRPEQITNRNILI